MRASKRKVEGRSCACGNPDQDKLATCSNCGAQEHIYCMLIPQRVVPRVWQCGDCVAFRAAPSTSPRKIIPPIRKHNSQNGKVKCIDDEEASRLHGRRWGGSSAHNGFIIPPNKKPYAYKGNKFSSRLPKVSPEPPNKVKRTCSPPSEFSKKNSYAFQRNGLFSRLQEVPPEPPVKMRRNNSPPSSFSKPLHSRNNVHLRSDQALKDRKDKYPEDPIVGQLAEEALVHENGAELSNMITADPVAEESPKPMPPNYLSPINDSDTLVQRPLEYVSKGTPMERCLLQEEFEAASQKAGGDVHGVSHEFQQLGNLVIPKCSPSTIMNHLPRITNFPPLPSESATWTGMFIFSDPAIPGDCYGMFEAYPPTKVHRTAYEYSGFLNDELLVDLIPLSELSPYLLRNDSWNYWDSALYIIPDCTQTRSVQAYHRLLRVMLTQEVVMKSSVDGGVELLIFTSKHLHLDAKRSSERVYLCAVFYDVLSYNDKV